MKLYISNPENVEIPLENSVNLFIDGETSTLRGKNYNGEILEFSKTIEVQPDYSNLGITISSLDVKAGKYFIDSAGTLVEGSLNESSFSINNNEVIVSDGFINETQTIQVGTLYSGSNELTPGTEDQTIVADTFLSNQVVIKGDSNLLPENIKEGIVIFGVSGTYVVNGSGSSSSESSDIVSLLNLPRAISEYTNDNIGEIISIPYTDESGIISGPIEFEVVGVNHHKDINDESKPTITLMSKNILRYAAFDAIEQNNSDDDRTGFGNNRWSVSNIRQWLNSEGAAGSWYIAQHEYDEEPNTSYVNEENGEDGSHVDGAYADDPGFLAGFSQDIKSHFAIVENTTWAYDTSATDITNDKVFLASYTEMGLGTNSGIAEGTHLSIKYPDNNSRIKSGAISYWLRSAYPDDSINIWTVFNDGSAVYCDAWYGAIGLAPLLVLKD